MKIQSTKTRQRVGLAAIAGGCSLLLFLAFAMPSLALLGAALWEKTTGRRMVLEPTSWPWAYEKAESKFTDVLQVYGKKAAYSPKIVFLAIDSPSFDQRELTDAEREHPALQMMANGFPFPRAVYPLILQRLKDAGARLVMLDIMFPGPKEGDELFHFSLFKHRDSVVIGTNLQLGDTLHGSDRGTIFPPSTSLIPGDDGEGMYDDRAGYVNFKPDAIDNVVRRSQYRTTLQEYFGWGEGDPRELLSLTAQGANKAGYGSLIPKGREPVLFRFIADPPTVSIGDIFVPTYWQKNFRNGEFFRDKLVFIGPYGNWSKDELMTPFGSKLGPLIHISALNAMLTQDFLHESSRWTDVFLILVGGVAAVLAGYSIVDPIGRAAVLVALAAIFVGCAFLFYNASGLLLNLLGPTAALLTSGFIGLVWERVLERQEKARVRQTLERYVSKDVVKEVLDNPQSFLNTEGGMRKPVTVLFSDIRGFTAMAESADVGRLVEQLNEYFTEMVRIVFANRGTLDKFIGDAVMAHWGSIVSRGEGPDACRAVAAALDMQRALPKLNARWKELGMYELKIGVGVNHGEAICAHIGSYEKHEVTAIGDAVNLASRLEGATKTFHQDLLIGEKVAPLVADHYILRPVDLMQVQGKQRPVEVFAVLGEIGKMETPAWLEPYREGIRLFRHREFAAALEKFADVLSDIPGDWLCEEYQRRCREYQEDAPGEDWDGVYVLTRK